MTAGTPARRSFFLGSGAAARYCLYTPAQGECRGALLYVPPFGDEMNKARRMAALQARALGAAGYAVLQLDLYGCGDSAGDFGDARWDIWLDDLARGAHWLEQQLAGQLSQPPALWGLRLGALLALDYAQRAPTAPAALLLWQPVCKGQAYLTQLLRLKVASALFNGDAPASTDSLRATLARGTPLEIAGYTLAPQLADAIDSVDAGAMLPPCPLHWLEMAGAPERPLAPASLRMLDVWRAQGVAIHSAAVTGPQFWATPEISTSAALLEATLATLKVTCHAG